MRSIGLGCEAISVIIAVPARTIFVGDQHAVPQVRRRSGDGIDFLGPLEVGNDGRRLSQIEAIGNILGGEQSRSRNGDETRP